LCDRLDVDPDSVKVPIDYDKPEIKAERVETLQMSKIQQKLLEFKNRTAEKNDPDLSQTSKIQQKKRSDRDLQA
jgi:hypothetical protein